MNSIVEKAIQGRYKKIKANAERIRREKRGMKKARRFHTRLDSLYPGEDQISKVKRRAMKTRPREVQQAKPEEISRDVRKKTKKHFTGFSCFIRLINGKLDYN